MKRKRMLILPATVVALAVWASPAAAGGACTDSIALSASSYEVQEGQPVSITVVDTRTGTCGGGASVHYATSDGSARAPADYASTSGTSTFPTGGGAGTYTTAITVPTVTNHRLDGDLTFTVTLSSPTGSSVASVGNPGSATVTIHDVDKLPTATTGAADNVSLSSATLNGTVNPQGAATAYHFEYGTSTAYGARTADASAGSDSTEHPESAAISGLQANTTYHFRVVASSSVGTSVGADQVFTTGAQPASVTTLPATAIGQTLATLHGSFDAGGAAVTYHFDYGPTTAYGTTTPGQHGRRLFAAAARGVAATVRHLKPNTVYHYRLVITGAGGTTTGGDRSFRTAAKPAIRVSAATVLAGQTVRVFGNAGGCRRGDAVTLISSAFSHRHEFAGVSAIFATVRAHGAFSTTTRIPRGKHAGRYTISARCGGGNLGVVARLRVTAPPRLPRFTG